MIRDGRTYLTPWLSGYQSSLNKQRSSLSCKDADAQVGGKKEPQWFEKGASYLIVINLWGDQGPKLLDSPQKSARVRNWKLRR